MLSGAPCARFEGKTDVSGNTEGITCCVSSFPSALGDCFPLTETVIFCWVPTKMWTRASIWVRHKAIFLLASYFNTFTSTFVILASHSCKPQQKFQTHWRQLYGTVWGLQNALHISPSRADTEQMWTWFSHQRNICTFFLSCMFPESAKTGDIWIIPPWNLLQSAPRIHRLGTCRFDPPWIQCSDATHGYEGPLYYAILYKELKHPKIVVSVEGSWNLSLMISRHDYISNAHPSIRVILFF